MTETTTVRVHEDDKRDAELAAKQYRETFKIKPSHADIYRFGVEYLKMKVRKEKRPARTGLSAHPNHHEGNET